MGGKGRVISGIEGQKVSGCWSIFKAWADMKLSRVNTTTNCLPKKHFLGWQQLAKTGCAAANSCPVSILERRRYTALIVPQQSRLTVSVGDITPVIWSLFHRFTSASTVKRDFVHPALPDRRQRGTCTQEEHGAACVAEAHLPPVSSLLSDHTLTEKPK